MCWTPGRRSMLVSARKSLDRRARLRRDGGFWRGRLCWLRSSATLLRTLSFASGWMTHWRATRIAPYSICLPLRGGRPLTVRCHPMIKTLHTVWREVLNRRATKSADQLTQRDSCCDVVAPWGQLEKLEVGRSEVGHTYGLRVLFCVVYESNPATSRQELHAAAALRMRRIRHICVIKRRELSGCANRLTVGKQRWCSHGMLQSGIKVMSSPAVSRPRSIRLRKALFLGDLSQRITQAIADYLANRTHPEIDGLIYPSVQHRGDGNAACSTSLHWWKLPMNPGRSH